MLICMLASWQRSFLCSHRFLQCEYWAFTSTLREYSILLSWDGSDFSLSLLTAFWLCHFFSDCTSSIFHPPSLLPCSILIARLFSPPSLMGSVNPGDHLFDLSVLCHYETTRSVLRLGWRCESQFDRAFAFEQSSAWTSGSSGHQWTIALMEINIFLL